MRLGYLGSVLLFICVSVLAAPNPLDCQIRLTQSFRKNPLSKGVAVIVDGYSSGNMYAPAFRGAGYQVIHLKSSHRLPKGYASSFRPEDYDAHLVYRNDFSEILRALKELSPAFILAGSESPGIELAARLNHALRLPYTQDIQKIDSFRDKYFTAQFLRAADVMAPDQTLATSLRQAQEWASDKFEAGEKVVLKPRRSAGTDQVYICKTAKEVELAYRRITQSEDMQYELNTTVLVQEYLDGEEFALNFVSLNGTHKISEILKYDREEIQGAATRYRSDRLIGSRGQLQAKLIAYAKQVLDALGIKNGPSHLEIKMTSKGPVLVDLGVRLCGGGIPALVKKALRRNQVDLLIESVTAPHLFMLRPEHYEIHKHAAWVFLRSEGNGARMSQQAKGEVLKIPGVTSVQFYFDEGATLNRTVDSDSVTGLIEVLHEDSRTLEAAVHALNQMQVDGRFELP